MAGQVGASRLLALALACGVLFAGCTPLREAPPERFSDHADQLRRYAALSQALYRDRPAVAGGEVFAVPYDGLLGRGSSRYALLTDDARRTHTVVIQGTGTLQDLGLGLDVAPVRDRELGMELHSGFRSLALAVRSDLLPRLKEGYAIGLGGHSAGGAAAQILALYLVKVDARRLAEVYTFGQPKFGSLPGKPPGARSVRVVNCDDAVALLPNPGASTGWFAAYRHSGPIVFLGEDGRVWFSRADVEPDSLGWIGRSLVREALSGRPFQAHLIGSYLERLEKARVDAEASDYGSDAKSICQTAQG